uniref:ADAMTS-like 7 n=1 Tax=Cyclopterus lumpus TaxID=8103 RepID=A0A8C2WE26_CYCLU
HPSSQPLLTHTHTHTHIKHVSVCGFRVVRGNFSRSFLQVGYHKIAEIPAGARNVSIRETVKSRNYLGTHTHAHTHTHTIYLTADLKYQRPNEIRSRNGESITASGPLTENLHVYLIYQQPGPSVHYEYIVPLKNTPPTPEPDPPSDVLPLGECTHTHTHLHNPPPPPPPPPPTPHTHTHTHKLLLGRQLLWGCVEQDSETTVPSDLCDPALEPTDQEEDCNTQPCPAYWDVGEWSECSRRCGPGTQHRQVICRRVTRVRTNGTETSVTVAEELCGSPDRPVTTSTCQLKICSQWEMRSEWSPCSVPCGVGQRSREVVCVSNQGDVEEDEECNMNLKPDTLENCDMGVCARSWFTSLWSQRCSAECGRGSRTRTVLCLMDHVTDLPLDICEGQRPAEAISCESGPCQNRLEWSTGPWSQCSAECGNGTQTRSVVCIFNNDDGLAEVADWVKCSSLSQPITAQPCRLKPCGVQWYVTEWSACSRSCNGGYRMREVRCLANNATPSDRCDPGLTPEGREECNEQPCITEMSESADDQYHNCMVVVQARLCVYTYYRSVCCASCSRVKNSYPASLHKNHIRR